MKNLVEIMQALQEGKKVYKDDAKWKRMYRFIELDDTGCIVDYGGNSYTSNYNGTWNVIDINSTKDKVAELQILTREAITNFAKIKELVASLSQDDAIIEYDQEQFSDLLKEMTEEVDVGFCLNEIYSTATGVEYIDEDDFDDYQYSPEEAEMLGLIWDKVLGDYYPKY